MVILEGASLEGANFYGATNISSTSRDIINNSGGMGGGVGIKNETDSIFIQNMGKTIFRSRPRFLDCKIIKNDADIGAGFYSDRADILINR